SVLAFPGRSKWLSALAAEDCSECSHRQRPSPPSSETRCPTANRCGGARERGGSSTAARGSGRTNRAAGQGAQRPALLARRVSNAVNAALYRRGRLRYHSHPVGIIQWLAARLAPPRTETAAVAPDPGLKWLFAEQRRLSLRERTS